VQAEEAMAAMEAEPACFSMGRVVTRTFDVLGQNFVPYFALAAITVAPTMTIGFAIARSYPVYITPFSPTFLTHTIFLILNGLFSMLLGYFLQAAIVQGTITTLNGNPAGLGECLSTALHSFLRLTGIGFLAILGVAGGMILFIVPAFILMTMWAVVAPVCVVENRTVGATFTRSTQLTRDHRWAIFAIIVVFMLATMVAHSAIRPLSGIGLLPVRYEAIPSSVVYWLATAILRIVTASIGAVGVASIYYEPRSIKEGIGPEQLAAVFA
jgi:hypothetical protein